MQHFSDDQFSIDYMRQPVLAGRFEWRDLFRIGPDPDHWGERPGAASRALVIGSGKARVKKWIDPMEQHPELFLEFANLTTPARASAIVASRVQAFANTYGPLRAWDVFTTSTLPMAGARNFSGHSYLSWVMESRKLRHAIQLWDSTGRSRPDGKADNNSLRKAITWIKEKNPNTGTTEIRVEYRPANEDYTYSAISSLNEIERPMFAGWRFGEHLRPARFWIAKTINRALARDVTHGFVFQPNPNQPKTAVLSSNLRGCLWHQFYRAYIGEFRIARCLAPDCGGWMRYDRRTKQMHERCANRTRQRKYRAKKR